MTLKKKDYFTYVITYTISNQAVADALRDLLTKSRQNGGYGAVNIDQSTYGIKNKTVALDFMLKLREEILEIYKHNGAHRQNVDVVYVLSSSDWVLKKPNNPKRIYQYDIFTFDK